MLIKSLKYIIRFPTFTTLKGQDHDHQHHGHSHHHDNPHDIPSESEKGAKQFISKMPFYKSFREGLDYELQNKPQQANKCYQNALNLLDNKDQLFSHYGHIFKKLLANNYYLKKYKDVQQNIYSMIKYKKNNKIQSALIYDDYNNLFQFFLKTNPEKAILLGRALLSKRQEQNLTVLHKKLFQFNLANAYFLVGNYSDAKSKYSQCLQNQPNDQLKIKIYNNLGLACWWGKNPLISQKQINKNSISSQLIDSDFKQSKSIFLKGLYLSQSIDEIFDAQQKYILKQALSETQLNLKITIKNAQSIQLIYNLVQYYINNEPFQKMKILYWLRILLKCSEHQNKQIFNQAYITLCMLNNQKQLLIETIDNLLKKYQNSFEIVYYTKIAVLIQKMKGDKQKAKELSEKVTLLQKKYLDQDKYIFKRKYLKSYEFKI